MTCYVTQGSMMEMSTQAPSMSELRGLGGTLIEPFERPVLSKEQVYAKYPHLAGLSSPTSQRSVQVAGHSDSPVSEGASDEVRNSLQMSFFEEGNGIDLKGTNRSAARTKT